MPCVNTKYELLPEDTLTLEDGRVLHRIRALRNIGPVHAGQLGGYIESDQNLSDTGLCWVAGQARVYGDARVTQDACVVDHAQVFDGALIRDRARVSDRAVVTRWPDAGTWLSYVHSNARVAGDARIEGGTVSGTAVVHGTAQVRRGARVSGRVYLYGDSVVESPDANLDGGAIASGRILRTRDVFYAGHVGAEDGMLTVYKGPDGQTLVTRGCFRGTVEQFRQASDHRHRHDHQTHKEYALLLEMALLRIHRED